MRRLLIMFSLLVTSLALSARAGDRNEKFAIVIHGGAGRVSSDPAKLQARRVTLDKALSQGRERLQNGADALDVVESVIEILEDAPEFNAGRGAVMNAQGHHELDASIMDGRNRACGAVAGVRTIRHPISLARDVMTETPHVLLATDGAEKFADELGARRVERVTNDWFTTDAQRARLKEAQSHRILPTEYRVGTVGCVVLDLQGNIAAGTSTGGMTNKKFGRVGDSPVIGAGTFADNSTCGISCTGVGEDFIRNSIAFNVAAQMEYADKSLEDSVRHLLEHKTHRISGGIIGVSADGQVTMQFNTTGMSRATADSTGRYEIHVGK